MRQLLLTKSLGHGAVGLPYEFGEKRKRCRWWGLLNGVIRVTTDNVREMPDPVEKFMAPVDIPLVIALLPLPHSADGRLGPRATTGHRRAW